MTTLTESPAAASEKQQRVPELFIVGHPKCGTTALYEMLKSQPGIYMSGIKEPNFFAREMRVGPRPKWLPNTLDDYLALFADARAEQMPGEASPSYLRSSEAAARIAEVQPLARIVAVLREPASFLRSFHLQCLRDHVETEKSFEKAIGLEEARRQGRHMPRDSHRPQDLLYSDHVCYVEQLCRFERVFPAEQMLVLIYDDFRADNVGTVKRVLRFLGVDDGHPVEVTQANPTVRLRSKQLDDLVKGVSAGRGDVMRVAKIPVKTLTSRRMRRGALRAMRKRFVYGDPRPADEDFMLELRRRFRGEVLALSEHLGRDLVSLWGYDDLD
jgi:Sulfotransferase domain